MRRLWKNCRVSRADRFQLCLHGWFGRIEMPVQGDLSDHDLFGPMLQRVRAAGRLEGELEGRLEGERKMLQLLMSHRFGTVPPWALARLEASTAAELEEVSFRVLKADTLEELFP